MAPSNSLSTFRRFSRLPPELRLEIWRHSLPDQNSVTLHNYKKGCWGPRGVIKSEQGQMLDESPSTSEDVIDFDFRLEMLDAVQVDLPMLFVNREARSVALSWVRQQGVEMRFDADKSCHVFEKRFDARRDALFIGVQQWEDFRLEPFDRLAQPDLSSNTVSSNAQLKSIAVPHTAAGTDFSSLEEVFHWFPRLEVLYIVLDIKIDARTEMLLLKGDRERARARLQSQQWKVDESEQDTLVWNSANRRFGWRGGAGSRSRSASLTRNMNEVARNMHARLADMKDARFEVRPVYAVKA